MGSTANGRGRVKKAGVITHVTAIAATVLFAHADSHAEPPAHVLPGIGIDLRLGHGTQAAAGAGAFATSDQTQTQTQTQTSASTSTAAGGASTATGGEGGAAYNAGNSQIMNLGTLGGGLRNNPNIGLGLMVPTAPCRDTYSVGGSAAGMGGGVAWSKADRECRWQDIGAAFIRAGFVDDGLAMWCAIEGVEDIAPTCKRLKAGRQAALQHPATEASETAGTVSPAPQPSEW